jgi:hypothetical protein
MALGVASRSVLCLFILINCFINCTVPATDYDGGHVTSLEGERNPVCGRQFTGKATRLHKLPGGFSLSENFGPARRVIGTKTAETPGAESTANDPP